MNLSEFSEVFKYAHVQAMIASHIDMQVGDVRVMMQLPRDDLRAGCNFAAASVLVNLISGFSVVLFHRPDFPSPFENTARGTRFKELMREFYPWDEGIDAAVDDPAKLVYDVVRNPLTHAIGLRKDEHEVALDLSKRPLTNAQVEELESSAQRPGWLGPTLGTKEGKLFLSVTCLYWGLFRLFDALTHDVPSMTEAERNLAEGHWIP